MLRTTNLPDRLRDVQRSLVQQEIPARIWKGDHTVWSRSPVGIVDRLGWLRLPFAMSAEIPTLRGFAEEIRGEGVQTVVVLGMGGSSLAPEALSDAFGAAAGHPHVTVLDSTHPRTVRRLTDTLDFTRTLFAVSSKSGTTPETLAFFRYFRDRVADAAGTERLGRHFIAITDPGTPLVTLAARYGFRRVFLNTPTVGGRYAALSLVGLVPAALSGIDIGLLLSRAEAMTKQCGPSVPLAENPAVSLGALLGAFALEGRDKLTFVVPPEIAGLGAWIEQLVAESTGKGGKGILPVIDEPLGSPNVYGRDRVFIHLRMPGGSNDDCLPALAAAGHPVIHVAVGDLYDLGGQFFLWEFATAVAGHILGIHPFDQPDVELSKRITQRILTAMEPTGSALDEEPCPLSVDALIDFLAAGRPGDYVAIHAYLAPEPATNDQLRALRVALRDCTGLATTVGYGPRFLHSTGQLHKGDAGNGLFIQLLDRVTQDIPIPSDPQDPSVGATFSRLLAAQALGDARALADAGRQVATFRIDGAGSTPIAALTQSLRESR